MGLHISSISRLPDWDLPPTGYNFAEEIMSETLIPTSMEKDRQLMRGNIQYLHLLL